VSLPFQLLLIGFLYALLVGGLALLRREGISTRFLLESAVITLIAGGLAAALGIRVNLILFLIFLYLLTMRVRLLIDLANTFAKRSRYNQAELLYGLASRLWPDTAGRLVLKINRATMLLQEDKLDEAIALFKDVIGQAGQGYLGAKYEAAAHYNLGVTYRRKEMDGPATVEFNLVLDTWPASVFARRAEAALKKHRQEIHSSTTKKDI
jgi:tetratricopeptide (TPR) repeat protein